MPLLERAAVVDLLQLDALGMAGKGESNEDVLPTHAFVEVLTAHGVKPNVAIANAGGEAVGERICRFATNQGAELIVMGCYGHTRLREIVMGGATQHLLRHMPVPVLFSH
jgi:nucleotide-binding universal stress UspA family protein